MPHCKLPKFNPPQNGFEQNLPVHQFNLRKLKKIYCEVQNLYFQISASGFPQIEIAEPASC